MDKARSQLFLDAKPIRKRIFLKKDKKVWFLNEDYDGFYDVAYVLAWDEDYMVDLYKPGLDRLWTIPVYKLFLTKPNESTWNSRMESVGYEKPTLKF